MDKLQKPAKQISFVSASSDSYRVQVHAPVTSEGDYRLMIFRRDQIDCLFAGDQPDVSFIRLYDGLTIPVRMDLQALDSAIHNPGFRAGTLIDLTPVTDKPIVANNDKATLEAHKTHEPGLLTPQGVYLGQYKPKDRAGKSLGKIFNVFAAPQGLPEPMKYVDVVKQIAKLKGWNGFDGTYYANDKDIYAALKDGTYNGGWIIPPRELLAGMEPDGEPGIRKGTVSQPDNLLDHQNKGAFKGTFKAAASRGGSVCPDWYWSSTEHRVNPSGVWGVRFSDGHEGWLYKDSGRLSCRPVRLVPVI